MVVVIIFIEDFKTPLSIEYVLSSNLLLNIYSSFFSMSVSKTKFPFISFEMGELNPKMRLIMYTNIILIINI